MGQYLVSSAIFMLFVGHCYQLHLIMVMGPGLDSVSRKMIEKNNTENIVIFRTKATD